MWSICGTSVAYIRHDTRTSLLSSSQCLKKNGNTFREDNFISYFCLPSEKGSTLKGKNWLPPGSKFFLFRVTLLFRVDPFLEGDWCAYRKRDVIEVVSLVKMVGNRLGVYPVERCGAVVKRPTRDREVPGSIPTNCKCCFLEQETLSTLLSTGFYPGKKRATWKISTKLLNVLPSINKVDYYYYYYYY